MEMEWRRLIETTSTVPHQAQVTRLQIKGPYVPSELANLQ